MTREELAYRRRWAILFVLCFSLLVIVLDNTILNVAIPTIVRELHASNSQVQWMVDSYALVFAGLLLTAGSLGDRFGRRGALQLGLVIFGAGSGAAALANDANTLIATRACMGIGSAFIMPATLSIITNVFPARERGKAIGVWAGTAGIGAAIGPLTGGFLLEHFYWGSIFLVNIPIVIFGLLAGVLLIPTSKDPSVPRLDLVGAALSIVGLSTLVYAIIQAPSRGWTDPLILTAFGVSGVVLAAFLLWEWRSSHPMLELRFFRNPRFSAASLAIMSVFLALFGLTLIFTQYFQFILGFSPLATGVRLLPMAAAMMIVAPLSAKVVERLGAKRTIAMGMLTAAAAAGSFAFADASTAYFPDIFLRFSFMGCGMALTMAPATDSVMGSLPLAKAGVGSAMNDTTRQVGGALGIAILGSVFASIFGAKVGDFLVHTSVPHQQAELARHSVGIAIQLARRVPGLEPVANTAFSDGMHAAAILGAGVTLIGVMAVLRWLPARARDEDVMAQDAAYAYGAPVLAAAGADGDGDGTGDGGGARPVPSGARPRQGGA